MDFDYSSEEDEDIEKPTIVVPERERDEERGRSGSRSRSRSRSRRKDKEETNEISVTIKNRFSVRHITTAGKFFCCSICQEKFKKRNEVQEHLLSEIHLLDLQKFDDKEKEKSSAGHVQSSLAAAAARFKEASDKLNGNNDKIEEKKRIEEEKRIEGIKDKEKVKSM